MEAPNPRYQKFSVIVPSYNRREEIGDLLDSFRELDFPSDRFELIIADDGSTDDTGEFVKSQMSGVNFPLRFFQQENQGPGAARNMGVRQADGDFLIFIDSDCTVDRQWLAAIDRALNTEQGDAFGGPDSFRADFPPLLKAINYAMTSFLTTGGIRGHRKKKLGKYYPRSFNMGLSKNIFDRIGGFGTLRHGQDIEFSHRIITSGARVLLISDAIVFHKRRTSLMRFFKQVFNWGIARINLYKIDRSMLEIVHIIPAAGTFAFLLLLLISMFSTPIAGAMLVLIPTGLALLLLSGIHAGWQYRDLHVGLLVPLVIPIQVFGYGLGFLTGLVRRLLFGGGEYTGFRKKYYN